MTPLERIILWVAFGLTLGNLLGDLIRAFLR